MRSFGIRKGKRKRVRDPGKFYQIRAFAKYQSIALAAGAACFACTYSIKKGLALKS
jgi:hypothetical protein